jgi:hypothetical protein
MIIITPLLMPLFSILIFHYYYFRHYAIIDYCHYCTLRHYATLTLRAITPLRHYHMPLMPHYAIDIDYPLRHYIFIDIDYIDAIDIIDY